MLMAVVGLGLFVPRADAVRLKDMATFSGVRTNQLVGYGLVVGLSGTGDGSGTEFTIQSMVNMLEKMGVRVDKDDLSVDNVAAVMVTAKMPVSARPGAKLDVVVSSVGDASSLYGGVLLMTPLKGIDGKVYALAQGSLVLGGYSAEGQAAQATKNVTTVGQIPGGATVERGTPFAFNEQDSLLIHLNDRDFSTAEQVVQSLNRSLGGDYARAEDIATIRLQIPQRFKNNLVPLMASLENIQCTPDTRAKVVIDERSGTVVLGSNVTLSRVAVTHGNLNVVIKENANVSQPNAFSQGQTVVTPDTQLQTREQTNRLVLVEGANIQELVNGLNAIGATPRDIMSILRTLKAAGALHADLESI
nr:flagellar basal body P-ring protein FlgI [Desulfoplanes formicivorans]